MISSQEGNIPTENGPKARLSWMSSGREYHRSGMKSSGCSNADGTGPEISLLKGRFCNKGDSVELTAVNHIFGSGDLGKWRDQRVTYPQAARACYPAPARHGRRHQAQYLADHAVKMWEGRERVRIAYVNALDLGLDLMGMLRVLREIPPGRY